MPDDFKTSAEWQALNRIWKAVPPQSRDAVKDDFRLITERIRSSTVEPSAPKTPEPPAEKPKPRAPRENIMWSLSRPAKALFLNLLTKEGFDLCAYLDDLAEKTAAADAEELFDAYVSERDIDESDEEALREIIGACLSKK